MYMDTTRVWNLQSYRLSLTSALSTAVTLSSTDALKIVLTTTEGKTGKKPHQAFLTLHDPTTGLEESFPFSIKESGKGKVEVVSEKNNCNHPKEWQVANIHPPRPKRTSHSNS
jgi:hypothetical protein